MTESKSKKRTTDDAKPAVIADLIGKSIELADGQTGVVVGEINPTMALVKIGDDEVGQHLENIVRTA